MTSRPVRIFALACLLLAVVASLRAPRIAAETDSDAPEHRPSSSGMTASLGAVPSLALAQDDEED